MKTKPRPAKWPRWRYLEVVIVGDSPLLCANNKFRDIGVCGLVGCWCGR